MIRNTLKIVLIVFAIMAPGLAYAAVDQMIGYTIIPIILSPVALAGAVLLILMFFSKGPLRRVFIGIFLSLVVFLLSIDGFQNFPSSLPSP